MFEGVNDVNTNSACLTLYLFFYLVTFDLATAKDLLVLANSVEEQKEWVQNLSQKIVRKGVAANLNTSKK